MGRNEEPMLNERHCRKCKKEIYVTPNWVYKDPYGYYCSWKCFNHRFDGLKNKKGYHYKRVQQLNRNGVVIETYECAYDAAAGVDGWVQSVRYACQKGVPYKGYLWRYECDAKSKEEAAND